MVLLEFTEVKITLKTNCVQYVTSARCPRDGPIGQQYELRLCPSLVFVPSKKTSAPQHTSSTVYSENWLFSFQTT